MSMNYIIGAGGVGSWLCPALCKLVGPESVTLIDGDKLEPKNLDRQLFDESQVGRHKAEALAEQYGCGHLNAWYYNGLIEPSSEDWLLVCVDNMPARKAALESCDRFFCNALFAANERLSAEAYLYLPGFKNSKYEDLDPRKYYPEINRDKSGDPMARSAGCTGEAQQETPQLVTANFMAAALLAHMYVVWAMEAVKMDLEGMRGLPFKLTASLSRLESFNINKHIKEKGKDQ